MTPRAAPHWPVVLMVLAKPPGSFPWPRGNVNLTVGYKYDGPQFNDLENKTSRPYGHRDGYYLQNPTRDPRRDLAMDYLAIDSDFGSLQSCALVSKRWVPPCRRHLFHTIAFSSNDMTRWFKLFPLPEKSPAHYVRELRVSVDRRIQPRPREVFQIHPVLRERGEDVFIGKRGSRAVANTFGLEVTAVCNLLGHQRERGRSRADPGYHCTATRLGRPVVAGVSYPGCWEGVGGDRNDPEGEVWWEIATS